MSIEVECPKCKEEYDSRHEVCPACKGQACAHCGKDDCSDKPCCCNSGLGKKACPFSRGRYACWDKCWCKTKAVYTKEEDDNANDG